MTDLHTCTYNLTLSQQMSNNNKMKQTNKNKNPVSITNNYNFIYYDEQYYL